MKPATKNILKIAFFLLVLSTIYHLRSTISFAQSAEGLSAIPPRLEITVKADGVATQIIKVRNESKVEKNIIITIEDFVVNDDIGTPTIISSTAEDNRWAASNWIQISPSSIKLKGGETKSLVLTVLPPANALPGGHYAMVIHSPDNQVSITDSTGASIQTKVGTLVYVTIPGEIREEAIVKDFTAPKFSEFGPIDFQTTIQNLSDIHIKPAGNIEITNMFGLKTSNIPFNSQGINVFPGKTRDFENQLAKKWLFGRYKAELNAVYGTSGGVATAAIFFWVIPWRLLILIGTAIVIIIVIILSLKKKTGGKKESKEKVDELEKELETLKKKYKDQ